MKSSKSRPNDRYKQKNNEKAESKPGPFIVELENDEERENIMKRNVKYLKNTGASFGITKTHMLCE